MGQKMHHSVGHSYIEGQVINLYILPFFPSHLIYHSGVSVPAIVVSNKRVTQGLSVWLQNLFTRALPFILPVRLMYLLNGTWVLMRPGKWEQAVGSEGLCFSWGAI